MPSVFPKTTFKCFITTLFQPFKVLLMKSLETLKSVLLTTGYPPEQRTFSASVMRPSADTYRKARLTLNNGGARTVNRFPKCTRRTIVVTDRGTRISRPTECSQKNVENHLRDSGQNPFQSGFQGQGP